MKAEDMMARFRQRQDEQWLLPGERALRRIPSPMRRMTLDVFEARGHGRGSPAEALSVARSFALDPRGWLMLVGDPGVGKTHLAVGIVLARIAEDLEAEEARFVVVPDMLDDLRAGYDAAGEQSYYQRKARIQDAPLLVLDDFSLPRLTPWAREVLYMVVNYRYSRELPTVVTMNELPTGEEDPIASRLNDRRLVRPVPIVAQDYRREQ